MESTNKKVNTKLIDLVFKSICTAAKVTAETMLNVAEEELSEDEKKILYEKLQKQPIVIELIK